MDPIGILGSGGMGTALAVLLARSGRKVRLWSRERATAEALRVARENKRHLPGVMLPHDVEPTADPGHAMDGAEFLIAAIPSAYLRDTLARVKAEASAGVPIVSVIKGIEGRTFARPSEILVEVLGARSVSVLSGPSHAEEIARGLPASVVLAGPDEALNRSARDALNSGSFRVYTNPDALGVELAGALKNILGIAAGICEGLGFGDNAKAALLTRGLVEMARFAVDLGGSAATFQGLAGFGDVITTCYSPHGRNRAVGLQIGKGHTLDAVLSSMTDVAEGVPTTRSVHEQARERGVEMPITTEVYRILFEGKPPRDAVVDLMTRVPKDEWPS